MVVNSGSVEPVYRIGTVARLTGIAAVTLRMWERRYGVVAPNRSEGRNRLYSREDIARLALIKRLVDEGNAISTIANLSLAQLQERIQFHAEPTETVPCRVIILGDALPVQIDRHNPALQNLDIVAVYQDKRRCEAESEALHPDVLVVEYPTIYDETFDELIRLQGRSGAGRVVVVYGFGKKSTIGRLDAEDIIALRAPVNLSELKRACLTGDMVHAVATAGREDLPSTAQDAIPAQRYAAQTLARIAVAPTTVHCECPQHLAEMLLGLFAFEKYSKECINRSPADAALHAYLHATTAHARSLLEEALGRVLEMEHDPAVRREAHGEL